MAVGHSHCEVWSSACLGRSIPCQCCAWRSPWLFPRAALGNQPAAPQLLLLGAVSLSGTGGNNRPHHPFTVRSEDSTSPHSASSCSSAPRATAAQWWWDWVWPGCRGVRERGLPLGRTVAPHSIPHMMGEGEASRQWDGSVALTVYIPVLPPPLPSPAMGKFWLPNWPQPLTYLVRKAPKHKRQELVCRLLSGSSHLCSSPSSVLGLPPRGGCLSVLPQPSSDSTGYRDHRRVVSATGHHLCSLVAPVSPTALCAGDGDLSLQGEGRRCQL